MATYYKTQYNKFLANPRDATLAENVSLLYVTSTTKVEGKDAVVSHATRQSVLVKKKSEQIISAIESSHALVLDIETTLEFVEGGGAYLPSFDDSFLVDRTVTLPLVNQFPDAHKSPYLHDARVLMHPCSSTSYNGTRRTRSSRCASTGTRLLC